MNFIIQWCYGGGGETCLVSIDDRHDMALQLGLQFVAKFRTLMWINLNLLQAAQLWTFPSSRRCTSTKHSQKCSPRKDLCIGPRLLLVSLYALTFTFPLFSGSSVAETGFGYLSGNTPSLMQTRRQKSFQFSCNLIWNFNVSVRSNSTVDSKYVQHRRAPSLQTTFKLWWSSGKRCIPTRNIWKSAALEVLTLNCYQLSKHFEWGWSFHPSPSCSRTYETSHCWRRIISKSNYLIPWGVP